ncbi:hypothetical protein [Actinotalea ferrariae]|uniref:hypothetical protein n=1 Tax=Actinotalea ferrariae TaxID=1386098 RepID=UPI0012DBE9E5|nr:hypothetical protein [Actinotalea ferrariae]
MDSETRARPRVRRAVLVTAAAAVVVLFAALAYAALAWKRADRACSTDVYWPEGASMAGISWSWLPPGLECTYSDGTVHRSLWFSIPSGGEG